MKPRINPFLRSAALAAIVLTLGQVAHADVFDTNSTTAGFGVTNGSTYDWWAVNTWSDGILAANDEGTAATVTWQGTSGVSEQAFFIGSGLAGENYTVRLDSVGGTDTYIQNLALNVKADGTGALPGAAGNVTIGNTGDAGKLILRAANSVGAQNGGTLTINNEVNLNTQALNFRGGNVVINSLVSGTGTSRIAFGTGTFGLTNGTLTLANTDNTYAGRISTEYIAANLTLAVTKLADGGSNSSIGTSSAKIGINGGTLKFIGTGAQSTNLGFNVGSAGAFMSADGATSSDTITISGTPTYSAADSARTITLTGTNLGDNTMAFPFNNNGTGVNVLNKTAAGKWVITQANGFTGATNINGGILSLSGSGTTGGTTGAVAMGGGQFDLGGLTRTIGALTITSAYASGNTITSGSLTGTSYAASNGAGNAVVAAKLEGAGTLTKSGSGTLTLTGVNTFTGNITVSAGNLVINNSDALGTSATTKTVTITATVNKYIDLDSSVAGGSNITLSNKINYTTSGINGVFRNIAGDNKIQGVITMTFGNGDTKIISDGGTLTLEGNVTTNTTTRILDLGGSSLGNNTLSGVLDNASTPSLRKSGGGKWILSAANTFRGTTTITGGTLVLTNNLALQTSTLDTDFTGGGTLDLTGVDTPTIGGFTGAGNMVLPSNVTSLKLNPQSGSVSYSGSISGGTGLALTKSGEGTQVLSNSNSYSGTTTITNGYLNIAHISALGSTSGISVVGTNTAALQLANGITVTGKTIAVSGYGLNVRGGLQVAASSSAEWAGPVQLGSGDSRVGAMADGTLTISGTISDGTGTALIVSADATNGKVIVSGANNYTGQTQIIRGTLALGADNSLPTGSVLNVHSGSSVTDPAVFDLNNSNQQVAGLLRGNASGSATVTNSSGTTKTLTISNTVDYSYDSAIIGNLALVKVGAAKQSLTATNTYTGNTTVNVGTLSLGNGNANTGLADAADVTVAAGATLDLNFASGPAAADTVAKLFLGSPPVQVPSGTYDSSHPTYGSYFTGAGSLVVNVGPASSAYDQWATVTYGLSGGNAAFDFDYDNDGLDNGLEWILGGNPTLSDVPSKAPVQTLDATYLILTFKREDASKTEATLTAEWDVDLAGTWTSVAITRATDGTDTLANGVTVTVATNGASPDDIIVKIPRVNAVGNKLFGRIKATKP